ncbi:MAG: cytochrome c oxidase assembly protein [Ktedonobacterales bacterium]
MNPYAALTTWTLDPVEALGLALLLGAYLYAIGPWRSRRLPDEPFPRRQAICFVSGMIVLALTLFSPLDALGRDYLFTAHTTQLFLIITAATPLLLLGLPDWLVTRMLPASAIRSASRGLLFSGVAIVLFNGLILVWHIGPFYEAGLHNPLLHDLENLCFLLAGLITWWPLITPADAHARMANAQQIVYLVLESLPLDVFGAFTLFAPGIFYHTYAVAPRLWDISAILDQQVGGAILAVPGNILDVILMSIVFFGWIGQMEREQIARERLQYGDDALPVAATATIDMSGASDTSDTSDASGASIGAVPTEEGQIAR